MTGFQPIRASIRDSLTFEVPEKSEPMLRRLAYLALSEFTVTLARISMNVAASLIELSAELEEKGRPS